MTGEAARRRTWNARRPLALGVLALATLALLFGGWAARVTISGAVIGAGTVEVSKTMTALQHPIGGVVEEILATNGDQVDAGDVVVRLEDVQLRSDLKVVEDNLFEVLANIARLEAAIDGRKTMELHPALSEAAFERPEVQRLIERQRRQLASHFESLDTEAGLLDQQVRQVRAQIVGIEAQIEAKENERDFIDKEMERFKKLVAKGLLKSSQLFALEKSRTVVSGDIGRLEASAAELGGKIAEIELKRHTIVPKERRLAVAELSKLRPARTKFLEERATIKDQLTKLEVRAPIAGKIHDTKVLGLRSVVVAARPLMMIVPDAEPALVIVRISATDIDQVYVGQQASLKFKAFNGRHIPIILGDVSQISANTLMDPVTRKNFYEVTLMLREDEVAKLGERDLIPGMPVEAYLSTSPRTPLNYVLEPLMSYIDRAFRDA